MLIRAFTQSHTEIPMKCSYVAVSSYTDQESRIRFENVVNINSQSGSDHEVSGAHAANHTDLVRDY